MQSHCQYNKSQIDDHLVDRTSDTGFVEFPCCYCEEMITSVNSLETHLTNCRLYVQRVEVFEEEDNLEDTGKYEEQENLLL